MKKKTTSKKIKLLICKDYENGIYGKDLCDKYVLSSSTVYNILKRYGVKTRSRQESTRIYHFNEAYFETINTREKAYWLGFLVADCGLSLTNGKKTFCLQLKYADIEQVKKFQTVIHSEHKLWTGWRERKGKKHRSALLNICSIKFFDYLMNAGISLNKSKNALFPKIKSMFERDICRGLIDGDGCFWDKKSGKGHFYYGVDIVGTFDVVQKFDNIIMGNNIGINKPRNIYPKKSDGLYVGTYSGSVQAFKVGYFLYENSKYEARLNRKYEKYLEIKNHFLNKSRMKQYKKTALLNQLNAVIE